MQVILQYNFLYLIILIKNNKVTIMINKTVYLPDVRSTFSNDIFVEIFEDVYLRLVVTGNL